MLFSSATILSFSDTLPEHFDDLLANEAFEPCSSFSQSTFGWVSPLPDGFSPAAPSVKVLSAGFHPCPTALRI